MELLDLPPELFQRIVHLLVEDVGPVKAFATSFACKTFSSAIIQNISKFQPLGNLFCDRGAGTIRLFQARGADMMFSRLPKITIGLTVTAEAIADRLLEILAGEEAFDVLSGDQLDEILPAAAAAIGDLDTFRSLVQGEEDIFDFKHTLARWMLPTAVESAAATGKTEVLQWILDFIRAFRMGTLDLYHLFPSDSDRIPESWVYADFCLCLLDAVQVAIRRCQYETGSMILDFLYSEPPDDIELYDPLNDEFNHRFNDSMTDVVGDCMRYGDLDLFQKIMCCRRTADPSSTATLEVVSGLAMSDDERNRMFSCGSTSMFKKMLEACMFHVNRLGDYSPLDIALRNCCYDLVRLLLAHGAKVNACDASGVSVLQLAVDRGGIPNVQLLIEHGADPASVTRDEGKPLMKTFKLCQKAAAEVTRLEGSDPSVKMGIQACRRIWDQWKDDDLLKRKWGRYREIVAEMGCEMLWDMRCLFLNSFRRLSADGSTVQRDEHSLRHNMVHFDSGYLICSYFRHQRIPVPLEIIEPR
ncbi:hypothetical protein BU25DRAFT_494363 [Macroventuria anomochaeta]|uniref:Uncharacterized protein n=1 Tax=Macroventuria anomochaeta TaxID=301207 RepID=A0ACB6RQI7_9PLEO|nr:uncharacterized protein BU25DRAFT_494363 [Macroventuria anomochaeta]KAF2623414.1 hypothetical protein BU25DRAFT_494363 [Macroventuria anomochaeta]